MITRKRLLIVIVVLLQCCALAAICFQRETVLRTGHTVYMRTAPVDPRDLFRGDYVRLGYEASVIARKLAPISWGLCLFLESLKIFNTHYLVAIRPLNTKH